MNDREGWSDRNNVMSSLKCWGGIYKHSNAQVSMQTKNDRFLGWGGISIPEMRQFSFSTTTS
jgi:hypothetical protein